jgi:hypothetical protein
LLAVVSLSQRLRPRGSEHHEFVGWNGRKVAGSVVCPDESLSDYGQYGSYRAIFLSFLFADNPGAISHGGSATSTDSAFCVEVDYSRMCVHRFGTRTQLAWQANGCRITRQGQS